MSNKSVKKVNVQHSPEGEMGQKYLASGKKTGMRLWEEHPDDAHREEQHERPYETVGYVIEGRAELHVEDQKVTLEPGDSWVVPEGARHNYKVLEPFKTVEATSPPAHVHGRDEHA